MIHSYQVERVAFTSNGFELIGQLFLPNTLNTPAPALPILGPFCYVKEQAPTQYATRLAQHGFVALTFDSRNHGESAGEPRRYENPHNKIADVRAALDFLQTRSEVDSSRLVALGICQGASEILHVAIEDQRVRALATVSGQYLDGENKAHFLGGEDMLAERIARGRTARARFEATGEVDYLPIIDPERKDVGLPHHGIWRWYNAWEVRGPWENRYAVMSDADVWAFDSAPAAAALQQPFLMIHADHSDGPDAAHRHFEAVPHANKQLVWEENVIHTQFYDDPIIIDRAVAALVPWLQKTLA